MLHSLASFFEKLFIRAQTFTWANSPAEVATVENSEDEDEIQRLYENNEPAFWTLVVLVGVVLFGLFFVAAAAS